MMDEERETPVEAPDEEFTEEEDAGDAAPDEDPVEEPEDEPVEEAPQDEVPEKADVGPATAARRCPSAQCQYDKHDPDANFCILCGTLLFTHCEDCLRNCAPYARFCQLCGADLDELRAERAARE